MFAVRSQIIPFVSTCYTIDSDSLHLLQIHPNHYRQNLMIPYLSSSSRSVWSYCSIFLTKKQVFSSKKRKIFAKNFFGTIIRAKSTTWGRDNPNEWDCLSKILCIAHAHTRLHTGGCGCTPTPTRTVYRAHARTVKRAHARITAPACDTRGLVNAHAIACVRAARLLAIVRAVYTVRHSLDCRARLHRV